MCILSNHVEIEQFNSFEDDPIGWVKNFEYLAYGVIEVIESGFKISSTVKCQQ